MYRFRAIPEGKKKFWGKIGGTKEFTATGGGEAMQGIKPN